MMNDQLRPCRPLTKGGGVSLAEEDNLKLESFGPRINGLHEAPSSGEKCITLLGIIELFDA